MDASAGDATVRINLQALIRLQADARALKLPSSQQARAKQAGLQRSAQRGRGMAFAEVRLYQPGDDIRSIDWRVTARRQAPHTKLYEEERERPVLLLCDLGPSLFFASSGAFKQVRCAQLAAILAWLALSAGDQVGGIVFNGASLEVQRPARRKKSVLRLLDTLANQQRTTLTNARSDTTLDTALAEARRVTHTGGRIFVISDFLGITGETPRLLSALANHNSVTALRVVDPLERELPKQGRFAIAGPDGPVWFDASSRNFQQAWQEKITRHEAVLEECFRMSGVWATNISTREEPAASLKSILGPGGRIG